MRGGLLNPRWAVRGRGKIIATNLRVNLVLDRSVCTNLDLSSSPAFALQGGGNFMAGTKTLTCITGTPIRSLWLDQTPTAVSEIKCSESSSNYEAESTSNFQSRKNRRNPLAGAVWSFCSFARTHYKFSFRRCVISTALPFVPGITDAQSFLFA